MRFAVIAALLLAGACTASDIDRFTGAMSSAGYGGGPYQTWNAPQRAPCVMLNDGYVRCPR